MTLDDLSDFQIYSLMMNSELDFELREKVNLELKRRNFSQDHIDQLTLEYEKIIPAKSATLGTGEKIRIIVFPFFIPIQAIFANKYLSKGDSNSWRLYWKYLIVGWLFWTLIILLAARLFLK
jgi:hypothetical protein